MWSDYIPLVWVWPMTVLKVSPILLQVLLLLNMLWPGELGSIMRSPRRMPALVLTRSKLVTVCLMFYSTSCVRDLNRLLELVSALRIGGVVNGKNRAGLYVGPKTAAAVLEAPPRLRFI